MAKKDIFNEVIDLWFKEKIESLAALISLLSLAQKTQFSVSPHFLGSFYFGSSDDNTMSRLNRAKSMLNKRVRVNGSDAISKDWYKTDIKLSQQNTKILHILEGDGLYILNKLSELQKRFSKENKENLISKMEDLSAYCQILINAGLNAYAVCAASLSDDDKTLYRTDKSTAGKKRLRETDKKLIRQSAIKISNTMKDSKIKERISIADFVRAIKDDIGHDKMSDKKIRYLFKELQDEGEIKLKPREKRRGKM